MDLLNFWRFKRSNTLKAEKEETSDGTLKISPYLASMLNSTIAKAKMYGGDSFYEYRRAGILPEKYEYGMNCLFDSVCQISGVFSVQKIYEELRKDATNYNIQQDTSVTNLPGIPILFRRTSPARILYFLRLRERLNILYGEYRKLARGTGTTPGFNSSRKSTSSGLQKMKNRRLSSASFKWLIVFCR